MRRKSGSTALHHSRSRGLGRLLNLIRHDLDLSKMEKRFPDQGHVPRHLFARRECGNTLDEVLAAAFPWCATWEAQLRRLFAAYVEAKQRQHVLDYDDLLLYWAQMMAVPSIAGDVADRFDHVLVDEYQDTNRLQASILLALKPTAPASRSWATMPNPSTRSAPRRCATSSIFPAISPRAPQSSRWTATIARPSRSLRPRML
jgi:superfamily I DNA/RNA helicase